MSVHRFISSLKEINIEITVKNGDLKVHGSQSALTTEVVNDIRSRKADILDYFKNSMYERIVPVPKQEHYALSHAQNRLWVLDLLVNIKGLYNISLVQPFETLNVSALHRAVEKIFERHEVLRTTFQVVNGEPRQFVQSPSDFKLTISRRKVEQSELKRLRAIIAEDSYYPLDLASAPYRTTLLEMPDGAFIFIFVLHHILIDGWSIKILKRDFEALYEHFSTGHPLNLPALNVHYKDFAHWQNERLRLGYLDDARDFWLNKLRGELPSLDLPLDNSRPDFKTYEGGCILFDFPSAEVSKLAELGKAHQASLYMVLMAVSKTLLFRYTSNSDIIVGSVITGRDHADLEDQIGFYGNTTVVRSEIKAQDSFAQVLEKVRDQVLDVYNHQHFPFDQLVEELQAPRDLGRHPIFDVMIAYEQSEVVAGNSKFETPSDVLKEEEGTGSKFDLTFSFTQGRDGSLNVNINYDSRLFRKEKIKRMANHLRNLMTNVIKDSRKHICELQYLTDDEVRRITLFNQTQQAFEANKSIKQLIEEQAQRSPHEVCLISLTTSMTFRELNCTANKLAHFLIEKHNVKQGDRIGIMMTSSLMRMTALLGIIKTGSSYVPIDSDYPLERKSYILDDTEIKILLVDEKRDQKSDPHGAHIIVPVALKEFTSYPEKDTDLIVNPEETFTILYTSGSTGKPKGVEIHHQGLVNRMQWLWNKYRFDQHDVIYQKTPYVFDVSIGELFMPLCYGAKLLIAGIDSSVKIARNSAQFNVTYLHFSPTMLNKFLDAIEDDMASQLTALRFVFSSGEALLTETVTRFYNKFKVPLINLYGPTEASIEAGYYETKPGDETVPIGKPISNVTLHILDHDGNELPDGIPGEIGIGGIGLAKGYLNQPEKTKEKFVPDTFSKTPGKKIYRTGDVGYRREDGEIEFLGRTDNQTNINGTRIELGEIENAMLGHDEVTEAAVIVDKDSFNNYHLVGYYSRKKQQEVVSDLEKNTSANGASIPRQQNKPIQPLKSNHGIVHSLRVEELIEKSARLHPEHIAIQCEDRAVRYSSLSAESDKICTFLQSKFELHSEDRVAFLFDRSEKIILTILGILKTGCAYVPIDAEYPDDRIRHIIEDSGVKLIITDAENALRNIGESINRVRFDQIPDDLITNRKSSLKKKSANDICYLCYTSGSTGVPKGVMIEHHSVVDYIETFTEYFDVRAQDNVLQQSSVAFDTFVEEAFPILCAGGTLTILPKGGRDIDNFIETINKKKISLVSTTPLVINELNHRYAEITAWPRLIISGGDELRSGYIDQIIDKVDLYNTYGPTEATVCASFGLIKDISKCNVIGKPIRNHTIYILDDNCLPVPDNGIGELYISGPGVARGYINRPVETTTQFVANPFGDGVLYKTGDLGRLNVEGLLEFYGRKDNQLKINGFRIEPAEIDRALSLFNKNNTSWLTTAKRDGFDRKRLVTYYISATPLDSTELRTFLSAQLPYFMIPDCFVAMDDFPKTINGKIDMEAFPVPFELQAEQPFNLEIKNFLRGRLPAYMVPAHFLQIDKFPLTVSGKIDRKALQKKNQLFRQAEIRVEPRTKTEKILVNMWASILNRDQFGVTTSFFELGGHSLLATRVISAIRKEFGVEVAIKELFLRSTVRELAAYIDEQDRGSTLPPVRETARPGKLPLSFSQERLWFIDKFQGSVNYHLPMVLKLASDLDTEALAYAVEQIANRHEVLRTVFREEDGQPYQLILPRGSVQLHRGDEKFLENGDLEAIVSAEVNRPFDLSSNAPIRARLIRGVKDEYVFVLVIHHIATDGWSQGIFIKELIELYRSGKEGQQPELERLPVRYADYAIWQREHLRGELLEKKLSYWNRKLSGLEPLNLPTDYPRPSVQSMRGGVLSLRLEKALSEKLQALSRREGSTMFMTLLSAFKVLLYRYSGQDDICVGTPIANRTQKEVEPLMGFFVNTLALRSDLSGNPRFSELLSQVKTTTLEAYEHQDAPFEKVVERAERFRDLSRSPLFQVLFVLQNTPDAPASPLPDIRISQASPAGHRTSKFDLNFTVSEQPDQIHISVEYCTDLFTRESIQRMVVHYEQLVQSITQNPHHRIGELKMLLAQEEQELLKGMEIIDDYAGQECAHEIFESIAERFADSPALTFSGREVSYRELEKSSLQVARYLQQAGIGPDDLVGIYMDRSIEMIVSILGILRAGGAYIPLDPEYPEDRINYMIEDSQVSILLTLRKHEERVQELKKHCKVVSVDGDWEKISQLNGKLKRAVAKNNLAYVIYTSGSTGRPKGVMVEHRNLVNYIACQTKDYGITPSERILQFSNYCFDVSVEQIFLALFNGALLVLTDKDNLRDMDRFQALINENKITYLHATPGFLELLDPETLPTLKRVIAAGEVCRKSLAARWKGITDFINAYGPTESTVVITKFKATAEVDQTFDVPIGKALSTSHVLIVDKEGNLVPQGVRGELWVGGNQISRGYLNRPDLTTDKFIKNPFGMGRLYKTGDLVRMLPDGNIEFIGRIDNQVKIRGYRIELGEIESTLSQCEGVKQCVVLAKDDAHKNKQLTAYVVPHSQFQKEEALEYMKKNLPEYMVPTIWIELPAIPLTPNGKTNVAALPAPQHLSRSEQDEPTNELETILMEIWKEVLGLESVSRHDNFFEIGGNSIYLVKVLDRIRKRNIVLQLKDLFIHQNIKSQSQFITARLNEARSNFPLSELNDADSTYNHLLLLSECSDNIAPLFILPGSDGLSDGFYEIASALDRRYSVYGIQMLGIFEGEEPMTDLKEIARLNIQWIKKIQPAGPYRLVGHSFGGLVLFEMMKMLEGSKEKVDFACILDISSKREIIQPGKKAGVLLGILKKIFGNKMTNKDYTELSKKINSTHFGSDNELIHEIKYLVMNIAGQDPDTALLLRMFAVQASNLVNSNAVEGKTSTPLTLIKAIRSDHTSKDKDKSLGWSEHATVSVLQSNGDHFTMLKGQHAVKVADVIQERITKSETVRIPDQVN